MRSLFFKLFLSYWFTMILAVLTTVIVAYTTQTGPFAVFKNELNKERQIWVAQSLLLSGQTAAEIFERQGQLSYDDFIHQIQKSSDSIFFLLNEENKSLSGQPVHPQALKLASAARKEEKLQSQEIGKGGKGTIVAQPLMDSAGNSYVAVSMKRAHPELVYPGEGQRGVLRKFYPFFSRPELRFPLTVLLIIAAGVCYLLARSLTSPIRRLREATQKIAGGDFSARVGQGVGRNGNEIADLGHDFDIMADRIEKLMKSQKRLLRDISHELRSPLARLNVALELTRQRSGQEAEAPLNRIEKESERLNGLIGQLLTLTLLESGAEEHHKESVDLTSLIKEVTADANFEAQGNNRTVKIDSMDSITVSGSKEMLRRAIENVVRNAVRYTAKNSEVKINLFAQEKQASTSAAILQIRDQGPGISDDELNQIFKPFYRIAEARDRESGGTGIGLAITERAIRLYGGEVKALNAKEGGLIIEITIPVES